MKSTYQKHAAKKDKGASAKRPVTLSMRRDLLEEAKTFKINASRAAENGLAAAIRKAKESAWLEENEQAIAHYNKMIDQDGVFYAPDWMKTDGTL